MFQVSERENTENGKWLESINAFSQGNRICKLYNNMFTRFLDPFIDINITIVYSFNNSLSLKFFQRIKLTKQFNYCNKTIQNK